MDNLFEASIEGVVGHDTALLAVSAGETDLRVDVKSAVSTARRPDGRSIVSLVVQEEVSGEWALPVGLGVSLSQIGQVSGCQQSTQIDHRGGESYLLGLSREVVGALLGTSDTLLEIGITTVVSGEDRELEAARVTEVDIELAVLAVRSNWDIGTDRRDVFVEDESHDLAIIGEDVADGVGGAASTTVGQANNLDLVWIRSRTFKLDATALLFSMTGWAGLDTAGETREDQGTSGNIIGNGSAEGGADQAKEKSGLHSVEGLKNG